MFSSLVLVSAEVGTDLSRTYSQAQARGDADDDDRPAEPDMGVGDVPGRAGGAALVAKAIDLPVHQFVFELYVSYLNDRMGA